MHDSFLNYGVEKGFILVTMSDLSPWSTWPEINRVFHWITGKFWVDHIISSWVMLRKRNFYI